MARAIISNVEHEPAAGGGSIALKWRITFLGAEVANNGVDIDSAETIYGAGMTKAQVKAAIRAATEARQTALGYSIQGVPQHIDEIFHSL